ncbi:hypothetical protein, partial [Actinoplanes philippinensis]|uniref:hypothetical protein n=1 Tax=Actinoplanes philippinensis TaxID=35752 RepID=UPI0034098F45
MDPPAQLIVQVGDEFGDPRLLDAGHADDPAGTIVAAQHPRPRQWARLGEGDRERVRQPPGRPADPAQRVVRASRVATWCRSAASPSPSQRCR